MRVRDGETELTDGPFAITKEVLVGYYVLECADLDEALKHAARMPIARWARRGAARSWPADEGSRRPAGVSGRGRGPGGADGDAGPAAVARAFRNERAAVLATLIRQGGDFQLAEDALQDAFEAALTAWRRDGVPDRAGAWITVAARRRAIDRLRRDRSVADRAARLAELVRLDEHEDPPVTDEGALDDDRLRLIFTCCHPALTMPARVALTLRTLGGLTTGEIARAFLVAEPTMGKRIVRAKRKIADARIPLPGARRRGAARAAARRPARHLPDLQRGLRGRRRRPAGARRAVRRGDPPRRAAGELMPDETEVWGLLALMLLNDARRAARVGAERRLRRARGPGPRAVGPGPDPRGPRALVRRCDSASRAYQLQAAIAALTSQAPGRRGDRLGPDRGAVRRSRPADSFAGGRDQPRGRRRLRRRRPGRGWLCSSRSLRTQGSRLPAAARRPRGTAPARRRCRAAARAYERAMALTANAVERAELERRLAALR